MSDGQRPEPPMTIQCCLLLSGSKDDQHLTLSVTSLVSLLNCTRDRREMSHPMRHCGFPSPNSHPPTVTCTPQPYSFTCLTAFLGHSEKSNFSFLEFHLFSKPTPLTLWASPTLWLPYSPYSLPSIMWLLVHHVSHLLDSLNSKAFFFLSCTLFFGAAAEVYYLPAIFYFY